MAAKVLCLTLLLGQVPSMAYAETIDSDIGNDKTLVCVDDEYAEEKEESEVNSTVIEENGDESDIEILHSGISGDLEWQIDSNGKLSISGEGDYACDCNYNGIYTPEWCKYAQDIRKVDLKDLDTLSMTSMQSMFAFFKNLEILNLSNFDTSNVKCMSYMFEGCSSLKTLDLSDFDTSNVTTMYRMFDSCSSIEILDLSRFKTSKVKDMAWMFVECENLKILDLSSFDTSNVTTMDQMFAECSSLEALDLSNFDTSNVTNMYKMFQRCSSLETLDLSNFDTSHITDMNSMFSSCGSLETLDLSSFDTSNVTNMGYMFSGCMNLKKLNLSNFDTSNVTGMYMMFKYCSNLEILDLSNFDTSNVTSMISMFDSCRSLEILNLGNFDTSNVTDIQYMFYECVNLISSITISGNISSYKECFYQCSTEPNSNFEVKYDKNCSKELAQQIVDTKSSNSNVYLGDMETDKVDTDESVLYFSKWDGENQVAYFGTNDLTGIGYQVTDETDTSFLENLDNLTGKYVLVKGKNREDDLIDHKTLISIKPVETKVGTVTEANAEIIKIGEERYTTPEDLMLPDSYVNKFVLYHVYEDEIRGIEILKNKEGILNYWNSENKEVKIGSESYKLSTLADSDTIQLLDEDESKGNKVQYYVDGNDFIYYIRYKKSDSNIENAGFSAERDGWCIPNIKPGLPFGYKDGYRIPIERYMQAYGVELSVILSYIHDFPSSEYGGNCFGMSALAVGNYIGQIDLLSYFTNKNVGDRTLNNTGYDSIETLSASGKQYFSVAGNKEIVELIERAHIAQESEELKRAIVFKGDSHYSELLNYLSSDNAKPLVVTFSTSDMGHAVVLDTSEKPVELQNDPGWFYIKIYDPNTPYNNGKLTNPIDNYATKGSYILVNTKDGEFQYYLNGECVVRRSFYEIPLLEKIQNITYYDMTKLSETFFSDDLSWWPIDTVKFECASADLTVSDEKGNNLFEIKDNKVTNISDECEFTPICRGTEQDVLTGIFSFPIQAFSYTSDNAKIIMLSDNGINGIINDGKTTVNVDSSMKKISASTDETAKVSIGCQTGTKDYTAINLEVQLDKSDINIDANKIEKTIIDSSDKDLEVDIKNEKKGSDITEIKNVKVSQLEYVDQTENEVITNSVNAVTNLKASAYGKNKVLVQWTKSANADGYLVYGKRSSKGKYGYIGMTTKNDYYVDNKALDADYNFYWVYPYKLDNDGKKIINTSCKYVYAKGICAGVTNLKAAAAGKNKVKLTWTASANAEGYVIYGRKDSGTYGYMGMTSKTTYTDSKAADNEYNFYWVYPYMTDSAGKRAINTSCKYVYAKGVCTAVINLKATGQKGSVKLTWTKSPDADGYLIYGRKDSGTYGYMGMTSKTSYIDKKAAKTEYNFYWVYPYHKGADGKIIVGQGGKYVYGKAK